MTSKDIARLGGEGILEEEDLQGLNESVQRVHALMKDGHWHSADEIREAAGHLGIPASEGLRRMRELRQWYKVMRHKIANSSLWEYRLIPNE